MQISWQLPRLSLCNRLTSISSIVQCMLAVCLLQHSSGQHSGSAMIIDTRIYFSIILAAIHTEQQYFRRSRTCLLADSLQRLHQPFARSFQSDIMEHAVRKTGAHALQAPSNCDGLSATCGWDFLTKTDFMGRMSDWHLPGKITPGKHADDEMEEWMGSFRFCSFPRSHPTGW